MRPSRRIHIDLLRRQPFVPGKTSGTCRSTEHSFGGNKTRFASHLLLTTFIVVSIASQRRRPCVMVCVGFVVVASCGILACFCSSETAGVSSLTTRASLVQFHYISCRAEINSAFITTDGLGHCVFKNCLIRCLPWTIKVRRM